MNINEDLDYGIPNVECQPKGEGSPELATKEHQLAKPINNGRPKPKYTYLVTIKCHAKFAISKYDLDQVLQETIKKVNASKLKADWSSIVGYEEDSIGRMHVHTFLVTEKQLFMSKYQKPGWSIHFQARKDGHVMTSQRALTYITKQDQCPAAIQQRFDANQYRFVGRFLPALLDLPDQAGCKSAEGFCRVLRSDIRLPTYSDILGETI